MNRHYAAIDIGSNAVRLLIKRVSTDGESGNVRFSKEILLRVPLRLGFDVFEKGRISDVKVEKLRRLMKAYRHLIKIYGVSRYRACATSAMRDAENGRDIIKEIRKSTGINIEIIGGQEEATMVYNNHIECMEDRNGYYMYVDVGGGSTEVNLLAHGNLLYSQSFNIGTVRILTGGVTEAAWQHMRDEIARHTAGIETINIIGSGGNINKLYKMIEDKDKANKRVPVSGLKAMYDLLAPLTPEQRMSQFNLMPDRADVIVPASEIFLTISEIIHASYIYVPEIGLADGIIDNLYAEDCASENAGR